MRIAHRAVVLTRREEASASLVDNHKKSQVTVLQNICGVSMPQVHPHTVFSPTIKNQRHSHTLTVWSTEPVITYGAVLCISVSGEAAKVGNEYDGVPKECEHNGPLKFTTIALKDLVLPRQVRKCVWAFSVLVQRLLAMSQTRRVLSSAAERRNFPPGWTRRDLTQLSWPVSVNRQTPEKINFFRWR